MQNPRELALDVLMKIDKKEELSHIAIGETLEKYQFSEKKDRAFFTRLCQGNSGTPPDHRLCDRSVF